MEERTTEEVAQIFSGGGACVIVIDREVAKSSLTALEKDRVQRNVDHLELIKKYKKLDGTTSIWGSENFTAIDAAVTAGKAKLA